MAEDSALINVLPQGAIWMHDVWMESELTAKEVRMWEQITVRGPCPDL